jgi:hypothetical protein
MSTFSILDYRPFNGLVHDGSLCKCPKGTVLVLAPTNDFFVCTECLAEYPFAIVAKIGAPTVIKARQSGMSLAGQAGLIDGSARGQAIAWYYKEGTRLTFKTKTFDVQEPE